MPKQAPCGPDIDPRLARIIDDWDSALEPIRAAAYALFAAGASAGQEAKP